MRRGIFSALFALLLWSSSVYGSNLLNVSIYGTYDFTERALYVFWNNTQYQSFKVELHKVKISDNCTGPISIGLIGSITTTSHNLRFTNIEPNYYRAIIYGVNGSSNLFIIQQDFFIASASRSYAISWCNGVSPTLTKTIVYVTDKPTFENFGGEPIDVPKWQEMVLDRSNLSYFVQENMLFRNVFTNGTETTLSPPSGQVITYTVIPDKPTWKGINK